MICVHDLCAAFPSHRSPSRTPQHLQIQPVPATNMPSDSLSGHGGPIYSAALTGTLPMLEIPPLHPYTTHRADFLVFLLLIPWAPLNPNLHLAWTNVTFLLFQRQPCNWSPWLGSFSNPHHSPKSSQLSSQDRNGSYYSTVASTSPVVSSSALITKTLILNLPNKTLLCVFPLANACPPFSQPLHDGDTASFSSSNTVPHSEPLQIPFLLPPSLHHFPPAFHGIQMDFPQESLPWDILNYLIQEQLSSFSFFL